MPTHLFCLLPAASSAAPPADVRVVDLGDVVAWVADTAQDKMSRDARDAARAAIDHDRVIGVAISQGVTPMPVALSDPYRDDADMRSDVEAHLTAVAGTLAAVAGKVEMTTIVAVRDSTPAADAPGRGRAYLEQLRSLPARAGTVADAVQRGLARFGPARRRSDGGRVAISHLVARQDDVVYRGAALGLAGDGYRLVVDGPRAPYSTALFSPRRGPVSETGHDSGGLDRKKL